MNSKQMIQQTAEQNGRQQLSQASPQRFSGTTNPFPVPVWREQTFRTTGDRMPGPTQGWGTAGVAQAREAAKAFTDGLSPAPAEDAADSLVLVVSELVTNAVRHGGGRYTLAFSASPDTLTVAVGDPSPEVPHERTPDLDDGSGGFGWHLVNLLAHEVTIVPARAPRPGCVPRFKSTTGSGTAPVSGKTIRAVLPR
ncbi:ATP-binding protein [Streptomyces sp. NPDC087440]|uniref:ATP-binding protein n=1 Tax=Streptomyces sp. NPDC087440 TaxID=3365790 RepID=UPI00381349E5